MEIFIEYFFCLSARTFGRIRMIRNILLPVAFIGGFLTAIILGIKMIGLVNMFLISKLLALNLAVVVGKLVYAKKELASNHYHFSPYHSPSYGFDHRIDQNFPYARNIEVPTVESDWINRYEMTPPSIQQLVTPPSTMNAVELENILTNALSRIPQVPQNRLLNIPRYKRKSPTHHPYMNLLRPFT